MREMGSSSCLRSCFPQHRTSHNTQAPVMQAMIFIVHSNLSNCFSSWKKRYLICALFGKARSEAQGASHFPYTTSSCLRSHVPQQQVPHNTQEPVDFLKVVRFSFQFGGSRPRYERLLSLAARQNYRRNFPPVELTNQGTALSSSRQSNQIFARPAR